MSALGRKQTLEDTKLWLDDRLNTRSSGGDRLAAERFHVLVERVAYREGTTLTISQRYLIEPGSRCVLRLTEIKKPFAIRLGVVVRLAQSAL
jgi:hypothetical protein